MYEFQNLAGKAYHNYYFSLPSRSETTIIEQPRVSTGVITKLNRDASVQLAFNPVKGVHGLYYDGSLLHKNSPLLSNGQQQSNKLFLHRVRR